MKVGEISGPINTGRTGVVAKIDQSQEPSQDEIQKNFDDAKQQMLGQRRNEAFEIFASNVTNEYKKHNLVSYNAKALSQESGE
jgi:peptidyl-prolyl cis-trans isomerase D